MEDSMLDMVMEDQINGGYGDVLDSMQSDADEGDNGDEGYDFDFAEDDGRYDDDPSPYDGNYSEE